MWAGGTPRTLWADESRKSGVAPAHFGVFSTVTFACAGSLSPTPQRNCSRHRLKNLEKTQRKGESLAVFARLPLFPLRVSPWRKRLRLFEIAEPPTTKEASKTEKDKNK